MKISELIQKLSEIKDIQGDIEILHNAEDDQGFIIYELLEKENVYVEQFEENENEICVIIN